MAYHAQPGDGRVEPPHSGHAEWRIESRNTQHATDTITATGVIMGQRETKRMIGSITVHADTPVRDGLVIMNAQKELRKLLWPASHTI
jgi:hypothetical protein